VSCRSVDQWAEKTSVSSNEYIYYSCIFVHVQNITLRSGSLSIENLEQDYDASIIEVAFQEHNLHPNIIIILLDQSDGQIQHLKIKICASSFKIQDLIPLACELRTHKIGSCLFSQISVPRS
jgi:hypothetical protein